MTYIKRFNAFHRIIHIILAASFIILVATGIPLKYFNAPWAGWLMKLAGGYQTAGIIHRVCGAVTFGYFFAHVIYVIYYIAIVKKLKFKIFGPDSMVPRLKDLEDLYNNFKWFLGKGPRPKFDRWAYWEKFDYWGVFWGVGIIGVSGLVLWFPEFIGMYLPGWTINVATIIHSDEALLAAGFIFTVHFFNNHIKPEKFPMDIAIFTGKLTLEDFQLERPVEYQRLVDEKRLEDFVAPPPKNWVVVSGILFGFLSLVTGFFLLALMFMGQFMH